MRTTTWSVAAFCAAFGLACSGSPEISDGADSEDGALAQRGQSETPVDGGKVTATLQSEMARGATAATYRVIVSLRQDGTPPQPRTMRDSDLMRQRQQKIRSDQDAFLSTMDPEMRGAVMTQYENLAAISMELNARQILEASASVSPTAPT